jgi:hypothetical protein
LASYLGSINIQVTDVNGDSALMRFVVEYVDTTTLAQLNTLGASLATLVTPCTNGKVTSISVDFGFTKAQISAGTAPPPANATYPSVTDGARMTFINSAGGRRFVTVPAPLLTDFKTGSNTVNPADANMAALIAVVESLPDEAGTTNLYDGGVKTGRHARKRATRKSL